MQTQTLAAEAAALGWAERITLARANPALAGIYIETIRQEAVCLSRRPFDGMDDVSDAARSLLNALEDYAAGDFNRDDLAFFYEDLDELICEAESDDESTYYHREAMEEARADWRNGR
jgi:hypothetical protein